ncbi:hypothetical protein DL764_008104 [Monosporascus ibericus]|uniref:Transcription factor domain-containing protein n=1 Tax=Monosporascus ibericus TaxID=155417 RepID=A0A4Q4SYC2_9PEZI|nr:hypothetical protein DL764_008104 [Monosporascus ibericus]
MQNIAIAVGLASLSNLLQDRDLILYAREKYVTALRQTSKLVVSRQIQQDPREFALSLRIVVTLALFEVVSRKGSLVSTSTATTHIQGAIALLKLALQFPHGPQAGAWNTLNALQVIFSLFIPSQVAATLMPPASFEVLSRCGELLEGTPDKICVDVALAIAEACQLSAQMNRTAYTDGRARVETLLQQLVALQSILDLLEDGLHELYPFQENQEDYDPAVLFRGRWHSYEGVWSARIWNHFRWARILLNEMLLKSTIEYPISSGRFITAAQNDRCFAISRRMAEDILISTPSHWHHPRLDRETARRFEAPIQSGAGALGVPPLLWHLKVAGSARGVSHELWKWSYETIQVVWKDMGMQHAIAIANIMESERGVQGKNVVARKIKVEETAVDGL